MNELAYPQQKELKLCRICLNLNRVVSVEIVS